MTRFRPTRPQRTRIFIGCEGLSEMGYAGWLRNLVRDRELPFHCELSNLGLGAGDPITRIQMASARVTQMEQDREPFAARYLFLDTDQFAASHEAFERASRLAAERRFVVIWQKPTHKAFLLRHLPGCATRRPPDKRSADLALLRVWSGYKKPCSADEIARKFDLAFAIRVAGDVPALRDLLSILQLLPN